eukprot:TRINITY_DN1433_c0_g1_i1.p1 TRINITY_DN1433_c0_g1~~TRINITY_DN1433_c0_g1_i1.p1  ORF type:complete len:511 (-),score=88.21 TRINITY_DN1433_c0_g1_i1:58-1590(-)
MEEWKKDVLLKLESRNNAVSKYVDLIQNLNRALSSEKSLRVENTQLKEKITILQAQNLMATSSMNSFGLNKDSELTMLYKQNAEDRKQLLELNETLRQMSDKLQTCKEQLESEKKISIEKDGEIKNIQQLCLAKDDNLIFLKSELNNLQIVLVRREENVKELQKEVKTLKKSQSDTPIISTYPVTNNNTTAVEAPTVTTTTEKQPSPIVGSSSVPKTSKKFFQAHPGEANSVVFSHSGSLFATGGSDKCIKVWDTYSQSLKANLMGVERTVMSVSFSHNDELVLAASNDNAARIWSLSQGRVKHSLLGHLAKVYSAQFTTDGDKVITGSHDRTLKVWDLQKGYCMRTIYCFSLCNDLSVSPDGSVIISGHQDASLRFWDTKTGESIHTISDLHKGQITSVSLSPDGKSLLTTARDGILKLIDLKSYEVKSTFKDDAYKNTIGCSRVCWSPDGKYVSAGSDDGIVCIWSVDSGTCSSLTRKHKSKVTAVSWNPNGYQLASCDMTGNVCIWG